MRPMAVRPLTPDPTPPLTPDADTGPRRRRRAVWQGLTLLTAAVVLAHGGVWQWAAVHLTTPPGAPEGNPSTAAAVRDDAPTPVTVTAPPPAPAAPPSPAVQPAAPVLPQAGEGVPPAARPETSPTALRTTSPATPSTTLPMAPAPKAATRAAAAPVPAARGGREAGDAGNADGGDRTAARVGDVGVSAPASTALPAPVAEPLEPRGLAAGLAPARVDAASAAASAVAPDSALLRYALRRGALRGQGMLTWRQSGDRYRMELVGEVPLLGRLLTQRSEGLLQAGGLEPVRHTESRVGRSERAVNFIRPADGAAPRLSFSSRTDSLPLRPHTQDRLSWMAQLAARLQAGGDTAPATGHAVAMEVVSVSGDVQPWTFVLQAVEPGPLWHWRRSTDDPYETRADVWTDPRRQHWPARVELREASGDPLELRLRDIGPPP